MTDATTGGMADAQFSPPIPGSSPPLQGVGAETATSQQQGSVKSRIGSTARRLADETQQKVKDQARTQFDQQKQKTTDMLNAIASTLGQPSGEVDEDVARLMQRTSAQVQRLSDYLQHTDLNRLTHQAEDLARRQPLVFLGTAFVLGLAIGRFVKSARQQNAADMQTEGPSEPWSPGTHPVVDRERPFPSYAE